MTYGKFLLYLLITPFVLWFAALLLTAIATVLLGGAHMMFSPIGIITGAVTVAVVLAIRNRR